MALFGGVAAIAAVVAAPLASVHAHPFDLFGAGARAAGRGGAMATMADDHTGLYYNPATMVRGKPGVTVGGLVAVDDVNIRLKNRPAGYDLPDLGEGSAAIPSKYRLRERRDTTDLQNTYGLVFGGTVSLGNPDLRIGASVMLPATRIARQLSRYSDEREQYFSNQLHFELLGERSQHPVILAGIAYRFGDIISVGIGANVLPGADTVSTVYLADAAKQDEIDITVENDQVGRVALHAGVLVTPTRDLSLGVSWRGENYFQLTLQNDIQIKGFEGDKEDFPVTQKTTVVANYTPDELTVAAGWSPGALSLAVDAVWMRWSGFRDNQGGSNNGFEDTISVRAGLGYKLDDGKRFRLGVAWEPSPVPAQSGRTNFVDNDRLVGSIGGGHVLGLFGRDLELNWFVQVHNLLARDENKTKSDSYPACSAGEKKLCDELPDDTPRADTGQPTDAHKGLQTGNPGFPGWQSWGRLLAFGFDLTWRF